MRVHTELDDATFAVLVEFVTGQLSDEREAEIVEHVARCATCRDAIAWLRPLTDDLLIARETPASAATEVDEAVWSRVEDQLDDEDEVQPWKHWSVQDDDAAIVRQAAESGWRRTAIEGIEARQLSVDPDSSSTTMLIRMAPGTRYPAHEHGGAEDCYVLEGDLVVGDETMRAGDFQHMRAGSVHPVQHTRTGCLLMLRSSVHDRLLDEALED